MRLRVGSGFGIPIYLHWTFFLLPLWILWTRPGDSSVELAEVFTLLPLVFVCVVLHEFGHALMARRFGIATQDVTLYPIGGVARLMKMTDQPIEEFLVAVAGPAVNVVIAILLTVLLVAVYVIYPSLVIQTHPSDLRDTTSLGWVALGLVVGNVAMVLFNLLPAFPLDGGRVLRALLSAWLGHYQATQIAVAIGIGMAILMGIAGLIPYFHSPMLAVIGFFIFFAGQQELMAARFREYQLRRQQDEEPLTVRPVRPAWPTKFASATTPAPLLLQPKISVYTWDNQTGTWRKEPGPLT